MRGFGYVYKGTALLRNPGLRRFVMLPLLVNVLVFAAGSYWAFSAFEQYLDRALPAWLEWARWVILPLLSMTFLIITFYAFTLIANLIAAPFNSLLAEKIERRQLGEVEPEAVPLAKLARASVAAIGSEVRKLLYLALWALPLLLLFLVPGINLLAPLLWALFGAWMLAIEYVDYPMGNHQIGFKQQRAVLRSRRSLSLGFGAAVLLMTFVPVLNFFAMPAGVAGATLLWLEQLREA